MNVSIVVKFCNPVTIRQPCESQSVALSLKICKIFNSFKHVAQLI